MLDTIVCVSEEDPPSFHPDTVHGYSVRLSYRCGDADEDAARAAYLQFLLDVEHVTFEAYEVDGAVLRRLPRPTVRMAAFSADHAHRYSTWLQEREQTFRHDNPDQDVAALPFFAKAAVTPGPKAAAKLHAEEVMHAAASWIAPVPQQLHLAFVLQMPHDGPRALVFLPCLGDTAEDDYTPSSMPPVGEMVSFAPFLAHPERSCESSVIKPLDLVAADQSTLVAPSGFIVATGESEQTERMLARFEQRAGAQLSGLVAVRELGSALRWPEENKPLCARLLVWSAVTAVACSLDTVLLALTMPRRTLRDGALLAPFLHYLMARLAKLPDAAPVIRLSRAQLRASLRNTIGALFQPATDAQSRGALVAALKTLCALKPSPWLDLLLEAYVTLKLEPVIERAGNLMKDPAYAGREQARIPAELLDQALAQLHDQVSSETGVQACVLRILGQPALATAVVDAAMDTNATPESRIQVEQAYRDALADLKSFFDSAQSGADDARIAVGSLLADLLVLDGSTAHATPDQLRATFDQWQFWARRLGMGMPAASPIDELTDSLPRPIPSLDTYLDAPVAQGQLCGWFDVAAHFQREVANELFPPPTGRFVPDHDPHNLAVHITVDPAADDTATEVDDFAAAFSGVALLVRRTSEQEQQAEWAHANLAEVQLGGTGAAHTEDRFGIQPIPTTVIDGRRTLFVTYKGLPIATSAFDQALPAPAASKWGKLVTTDYPVLHPDYQSLAPLAYGCRYAVAAHVVGRAGTLPLSLQLEPDAPWTPEGQIAFTEHTPTVDYVNEYDYSRRTAVGRPAITLEARPDQAKVKGIKPLALDYPRLGLSSVGCQFLDVWRNGDGSGAIGFAKEVGITVMTLHALTIWKGTSTGLALKLDFLSADNAPAASPTQFTIAQLDAGDAGKLRLELECTQAPDVDGNGNYTLRLSLGNQRQSAEIAAGGPSGWLRLQLICASGAGAISLADPAADTPGSAAAARTLPDDLVLLAAPFAGQPDLWKRAFSSTIAAQLDFPRVVYLNFKRWLANAALAKEAFGAHENVGDKFMTLLQAMDIERSEHAGIARMLDLLPDPCVEYMQLTLSATDGLAADLATLSSRSELEPFHLRLPVPSLAELVHQSAHAIDNQDIGAVLTHIDKRLKMPLAITCKNGKLELVNDGDRIVAHIPPGVVARLSFQPVVNAQRFEYSPGGFPPVMDPHLQQLAVGIDTGKQQVLFEGAAIQIETMIGPLAGTLNTQPWLLDRDSWAELTRKKVAYQSVGNARQYRLQTQPHARDWLWRQLSAVDVASQRWQFSGRPIYTWIDPKQCSATAPVPGQASLELDPARTTLFANFEKEAFFGRKAGDHATETTPLLPLPATTELLDVKWEQPSATLFRHRVTLQSRYAAAMALPACGACDAWPLEAVDGDPNAWLRVAMLAERSHLNLTRPQLRALIPATNSPEHAGARATPPLIGILQEHPFCSGGLAARIASEIRIGIGFELTDVLRPHDTRKEFGPDPRLSYVPYSDTAARALLLVPEGPIGLTFDADTVSGAAFPNTALIMAVNSLDARGVPRPAQVDEHFLSVVLRRYLDHRWLVDQPAAPQSSPADADTAAFSETWWITFPGGDGELTLRADHQTRPDLAVVQCSAEDNQIHVKVDQFAINGMSDATGAHRAMLTLCSVPADSKLAFLHTPLDQRRAILSVFLSEVKEDPQQDQQRGAGNAALLLASVEWSVPPPYDAAGMVVKGTGHARASTIASHSTALQWARTNTNFDTITANAPDDRINGEPVGVSELSFTVEPGGLLRFHHQEDRGRSGSWWLRAVQGTKPFPVHAQRHLAVLPSRLRSGIGRAIDVPMAARMAPARTIALPPEAAPERVRVIEFETPAIILGHSVNLPSPVPEHYRNGYFDLMAIGFDQTGAALAQGCTISFYIRVISSGQALNALTGLRLDLRSGAGGENAAWVSLPLQRSQNGKAFAFVAELPVTNAGMAFDFTGTSIDADGSVKTEDKIKLKKTSDQTVQPSCLLIASENAIPTERSQGLELRLGETTFAHGAEADVWLEVSMLVTRGTKACGFLGEVDFDWFFGGAPLSPELAVTVGQLRTMREAQARIIAVSQPVPLAPDD